MENIGKPSPGKFDHIPSGSSHTQVHEGGLYATGSTVLYDEFGAARSFEDTDDDGVLAISAVIRLVRDLGAFCPERFGIVSAFIAGLRRR